MMLKTTSIITDSNPSPAVQNPMGHGSVSYRHGAMRRKDSFTILDHKERASMSQIVNCDTKTGFLIDRDAHEYKNYKVAKFVTETELREYQQKNPNRAVNIESRTVDTGERKTFFGYQAKHLVTYKKRLRSATNPGGEETVDAWYIEHEGADSNCAPEFVHSDTFNVLATGLVIYPEVPEFHHTGPLPTGLAVVSKHTLTLDGPGNAPSGRTITIEDRVEELSDSPLPASLFERPSGLRENPQLLGSQPSR